MKDSYGTYDGRRPEPPYVTPCQSVGGQQECDSVRSERDLLRDALDWALKNGAHIYNLGNGHISLPADHELPDSIRQLLLDTQERLSSIRGGSP